MFKLHWYLASGPILLVALMSGAYLVRQPVTAFTQLPDAKARLLAAGFLCTTDSIHGKSGTGFLVSREPVSWGEAGSLCKAGEMGPRWKGKVWVTQSPRNYYLLTIPDDAGTRVWGDVLAFGDANLLSEIEDALVEPICQLSEAPALKKACW